MRASLARAVVASHEQQDVNEGLLLAVNAIGGFIFEGLGEPAFVPTGPPPGSNPAPALYFRRDGGAGTSIYKYQPGTGWSAL